MGLFEILKGEQPGLIKSLLHYEDVGQYGEYLTEYALLSRSMEGYYVVLKNLYLPMKGKNTEIDLLTIHEKGIFVFESKNYSGWIFGSEDQLKWTQCFKSGQRKHFYNPIKQNRTHIRLWRLSSICQKIFFIKWEIHVRLSINPTGWLRTFGWFVGNGLDRSVQSCR